MQAAHVNGCPCPASKMIPYYEERLSQMQTEIDTLKGLIPKNRIISLEDHPSYPSEDDYGALTAICTLLNEICVTGIMFQLEFTTAILTALSSDDDKRVEALYLDSDR